MHRVTVSIQGDVSVVESVEVNDSEALPLFIRLKCALQAEGTNTPARRRGRPRKEKQAEEDLAPAESSADQAVVFGDEN